MGVGRFGSMPQRFRGAAALLLLPVVAAACARLTTPAPDPAPAPAASAALPGEPEDDRLPAGRGREILEAECIGCHNLGGLWAYKGYYNEQRWRGLVETMIAHGANLDETATNELVDYLVLHFGPGSR